MKICQIAFVCLLLFAKSTLILAKSHNPYQIDINVQSQDETEQILAFRQAFNHLIKQLTGAKEIRKLSNNQILQTINQYRYVSNDDQLSIAILFNKQAIDELINAYHLSKWHNDVPELVTWMAIMTNNKQELLGTENGGPLLDALINASNEKGLPLIIPEMDLDDINSISFDQVWQNHHEAIEKASKRYSQKGQLTIKLIEENKDKWLSAWQLTKGNTSFSFNITASTPLLVIKEGILKVYTHLHESDDVTNKVVYIQIDDIQSIERYHHYLKSLKEIQGVDQVQLDRVTPESVLYKLDVNISKTQLLKRIGLDDTLELTSKASDDVLHYRVIS